MPKINEAFVKKAQAPAAGNKVYRDDEVTGFGLRVTATGAKAFVINYHINRRERRMTIGSFPTWTAAAAREEAKRLRRNVDQGTDPLDARYELRNAPNVSDLWKEYELVHLPLLTPRSAQDQRSMWAKYILPELAPVLVRDVTSRDVDRLHAKISEHASTRANRVLEVLRKALNLAVRWEWIVANPADGFRRNPEHSRERYLQPNEYARVFGALDRMPNQQAANAIRLLAFTGARRGEILSLEWTDLDFGLGLWNRPSEMRIPRKVGIDSTRSRALIPRHRGQPFHGIAGS